MDQTLDFHKDCPSAERWHEFAVNKITGETKSEMDRHLAICSTCSQILTAITRSSDNTASALTGQPSQGRNDSKEQSPNRDRLAKASPNPIAKKPLSCIGDYEILEEIARGGMGVVFKARHLKLGRTAAIKLIRSGDIAADIDVQRFYAEASAAALLDHPNIVPVYEVGHHKGQHYYSMAFVEGQSLAKRLSNGPLPTREAAELVLKVARAIAYAHSRGVIHRDLKPGNILVDKNGQPHVTDFGLAKRVNATPENPNEPLTATGQILGTPSYMPPEQAAGKTEVGPLADVYSLGAVLYALLTGRPPFQSANVMDTILAVSNQEPIAPQKLNSSLPLDLNTICLKCLEKEPHRRYGSASELADELQRYLNGEPILARPITRVERAARWIARHPKRTGAFGIGLVAVMLVAWIASAQMRAVREESDRRRAESLVEAVLIAPSDGVPYAVENLKPLGRLALPILRDRFADGSRAMNQRLHAALALAALGELNETFFVDAIVDSPPAESRSILTALAKNRETVVPRLTARAAQEAKPEAKTRLALSLLELGDETLARELVKPSLDPLYRTVLIHKVAPTWFVSAARLDELADPSVRHSLCLGLGMSPPERFSADEKKQFGNVLAKFYQDKPDGATHSATEWTLRQWQFDLPELPRGKLSEKAADKNWFVNTQSMTMVKIHAGTFTMGVGLSLVETPAGRTAMDVGGKRLSSMTLLTGPSGVVNARGGTGPRVGVTLEHPFWLADREVTVAQFEAFLHDAKYFEMYPAERLGQRVGHDAKISKTADSPIQSVTWAEAALYCNWLSRQEGLAACYEPKLLPNQGSNPPRSDLPRWSGSSIRSPAATDFLPKRSGNSLAARAQIRNSALVTTSRCWEVMPSTC